MSRTVRIDRLVIEGGAANGYEASRLAARVSEEVSAVLQDGVPPVSRASLQVSVEAEEGIALQRLAALVAAEIKRKLV